MLHSLLKSNCVKLKLALLLSCAIVTTAFAIGGRGWFSNVLELKTSGNVLAQSRPRLGPVQLVRFTVYDVGIYPEEVRVRPGPVTFSIEDLTTSSSGWIVERVDQNPRLRVGVVNRVTNRLRTRAELILLPGRYELSDAIRREVRAELIVEP